MRINEKISLSIDNNFKDVFNFELSPANEIVSNNIFYEPKKLYFYLASILNDIIAESDVNFNEIRKEIDTFLQSPEVKNLYFLQEIITNKNKEGLKEVVIKAFSLYPIIFNSAVKVAVNRYHNDNIKHINNTKVENICNSPIKMHLGLYGKETEPSSQEIVVAISSLENALENNITLSSIRDLLKDIWDSTFKISAFDENSLQIFFANQIYFSLTDAVDVVKSKLSHDKQTMVDFGGWLDCYTWLTTDRDGRPHDTNIKTITLINQLENAIKSNYINELNQIFLTLNDVGIKDIIEKISNDSINPYKSPLALIEDLKSLKSKSYLIDNLIIKIKTFGFYFLKLEFRDNSSMLEEVLDTLIEPNVIEIIIGVKNTSYKNLDSEEKMIFLTKLLSKENDELIFEIKQSYLSKNEKEYKEKIHAYKSYDYIELMDIDPDYIKQVNLDSTLERFALMATYSESIHVHAIAETKGPEDALAILCLAKFSTGTADYIDVALQPEDSMGAVTTIGMIKNLYENPIYCEHLKKRGSSQYIIFGPSDTGKQGGKAMHLANMQLAHIHRMIATSYNVKPIIHVIVGYEHARCNGFLYEILDGYGTLQQTESQYMMAGFNEMRSQLLTSRQVTNFLSSLYVEHVGHVTAQECSLEKRYEKAKFWLEIVGRYQKYFHDHRCLPDLLRAIARFDVINATAKGTRPPSRILNTKNLETIPSAIRAIPWSRSFLLAGIHCEIIGAGLLDKLQAQDLHDMYLHEVDFKRYVHHIAYGISRTDIDFAWETAGVTRPSVDEVMLLASDFESNKNILSVKHMLAWIDYEVMLSASFIYKAVYGTTSKGPVDIIQLLQHINPGLSEEVLWKNKMFSFHKKLLLEVKHEPSLLKEKYIKDLFTGALSICNTSMGMIHPQVVNGLNWSDATE
jgi:phosphoenolpyruvate carboxylase